MIGELQRHGGPGPLGGHRFAVRARRAFDGTAALPGGALVLCEGGRIAGVEPAAVTAPDGWPVHEFPHATLLPGLVDSHVHLCADSRVGALDRLTDYDDATLDAVVETALRAQLAAGVTTVRDLGDRRFAVLPWRERIDTGTAGFAAPRIVAAGPPITSVRGHCWLMGGEAETAEELRAAVTERAERGVDVVKVMASGGALTPGTGMLGCQYTVDQLRLVVEQAHASGLPVTAHAHALAAVTRAVEAGVDGIEHCSCLTEQGRQLPDDLMEQMAADHIAVCPTLGIAPGTAPPPAVLAMQQRTGLTWQSKLDLVARQYAAGVPLVSGIDAGIGPDKPHGAIALAIADLVDAGIPAAAALTTATSKAAEVCGVGGRTGRLRPGYDADLLLVTGDPLTRITDLRNVAAVYARGDRAAGGQATLGAPQRLDAHARATPGVPDTARG